ncbi:MAG: type II toxin-antitoxin system mRNA interferase toxin, RelE/StbE family [Spirochaetota bacterium]|nr:type II toxin-antitoxin system mRNA interferase toxin, RelE/StbE family [Spirochaetota bacterium]
MSVAFSSSFKKAFKKRVSNNLLEEKFWLKLNIFINNPFDKSLRTHKLSGKLKDLWSFTVDYDLRVIFYFENDDNAIFIDIGTHDEVY